MNINGDEWDDSWLMVNKLFTISIELAKFWGLDGVFVTAPFLCDSHKNHKISPFFAVFRRFSPCARRAQDYLFGKPATVPVPRVTYDSSKLWLWTSPGSAFIAVSWHRGRRGYTWDQRGGFAIYFAMV